MKYTIITVAFIATVSIENICVGSSHSAIGMEYMTKKKKRKKKKQTNEEFVVPLDTLPEQNIALESFEVELPKIIEPVILRHWDDSSLNTTSNAFEAPILNGSQETIVSQWQQFYSDNEQLFIKSNIPTDCLFLALTRAFAPTFAMKQGLWQLDYTAAIRGGLTINEAIDERMYINRATKAAVIHLSTLNNYYNNWSFSVAAYLLNPKAVDLLLNSNTSITSYQDLIDACSDTNQKQQLESFVTAKHFAASIETTSNNKGSFSDIQVTKELDLRQISAVLSIEEATIQELNPGVKERTFRSHTLPITLTLPSEKAIEFRTMLDSIAAYKKEVYFPPAKKYASPQTYISAPPAGSTLLYHTVRSGDVLGRIAEQYHVRVRDIQTWNGVRGTNIRIGQKLKIYTKSNSTIKKQEQTKKIQKQTAPSVLKEGEYRIHVIKSGESPWLIAKQYPGVSADNILEWNNISNAKHLRPGMKLKIKK